MNFNLSSFLSGSLRILNIANKTLPLIKEATPAISNIRKKYVSAKSKPSQKAIKELPYQKKEKKVEYSSNNSLPTFFR